MRKELRSGQRWFLAAVMVVIASVAQAHQSISWEFCECEPEGQYQLTLSGEGTFSKSPDKAAYGLGEFVTVSFTPNPDYVFWKWACTPASHIASDSTSIMTGVFITGDTQLQALTLLRNCTVNVSWDKNLGSVNGDTSGSLVLNGDYGGKISLSAVPNAGYFTEWTGISSSGGPGGPGQRYSDSVEYSLAGPTARLRANFHQEILDPPNTPTREISVTREGGEGKVFTAGDANGSYNPGGWEYSSAMGYSHFIHMVKPDPGYFLIGYEWDEGGQTYYCTQSFVRRDDVYQDVSYSALLSKGVSINVEVEGHGVVSSEQFRLYYDPFPVTSATVPTTQVPQPVIAGNPVTMVPNPCPSWIFHHWEYQGAEGYVTHPNPLPGVNQPLTAYMNWHTDPNYTPGISTYARLNPGSEVFNVKAVFVKCLLDITGINSHPVTENHRTFNNDVPGVCTVSPVASGCPCFGWDWSLESIGGSVLSIDPSPPDTPTPIFTYTGLPSSNGQFGDKTLTVKRRDGTDPKSVIVQIFFSRDSLNHPELTPAEQATMIATNTGVQNVPNWFYYWYQTTAAFGQHRYASGGSRVFYNDSAVPPRWEAYVGSAACQQYSVALNPSGVNPSYYWSSTGIDTYAWVTRHEASHLGDYPSWWPNGLINVRERSPDNDGIPNDIESSLGYGYSLDEPDTNFDGQTDDEDYAIRTQTTWSPFSAQEEDWATPGQQSVY